MIEKSELEELNKEECEQLVSLSPPKTELTNEVPLSLDDIITAIKTDSLFIPTQWLYTQCYVDEKRLLVFFLPQCRKVKNVPEGYTINCIKEVIIDESMMLHVTLMQQPISDLSRNFRENNKIENITQLGMWLESVSLIEICPGITDSDVISNTDHTFIYQDITCTWRHKNCLLMIEHSWKNVDKNRNCKFCSTVKKVVKRKYHRSEDNKSKRIKFNTSVTNPQAKRKVILLKKKFYNAQKKKARAKYVVDKLKSQVAESMSKMQQTSLDNIVEHLEQKNIPENQLKVVQEIINTTKHTNAKSARYDENWILICLLMHMKSPSAYNFLRNHEILPMPCVRTIRRYL